MRQAQVKWLITLKQGTGINLNKERKTHEMQLKLHIYKGVPVANDQHKFQEEYEALAQGHGRTNKGLPQPKGGISTWVPNEK